MSGHVEIAEIVGFLRCLGFAEAADAVEGAAWPWEQRIGEAQAFYEAMLALPNIGFPANCHAFIAAKFAEQRREAAQAKGTPASFASADGNEGKPCSAEAPAACTGCEGYLHPGDPRTIETTYGTFCGYACLRVWDERRSREKAYPATDSSGVSDMGRAVSWLQKWVYNGDDGPNLNTVLADAFADVRRETIEACAKECEAYAKPLASDRAGGAYQCAKRIRALASLFTSDPTKEAK